MDTRKPRIGRGFLLFAVLVDHDDQEEQGAKPVPYSLPIDHAGCIQKPLASPPT